MASPASGPSRPISARRPPSAPSSRAKKSNGQSFARAAPRRQLAPARRRSRTAPARRRASRCGRGASRISASSSRPISGDFSTAASARSSSGSSAARAAAQRSSTAIWRPSVSRSAPAAGMRARRKRAGHRLEQRPARAHQDQNVARRGPAARAPDLGSTTRSGEPGRDPLRDHGGDAVGERVGGMGQLLRIERQRPVAGLGRGLGRHAAARLRPRRAGCRGSASCGGAVASPTLTPFHTSAMREHLVDRVEHDGRGAERMGEPHVGEARARALWCRVANQRRMRVEQIAARRPGTRRSTASRRRPRRRCAPRGPRAFAAQEILGELGEDASIARAKCPAPRRPECARRRGRACRAPRPRRLRSNRASVLAMRSSKSSARARGLGPGVGVLAGAR